MLYNNGLRGCHCLFTDLIPKMCVLGSCQIPRRIQVSNLTKELLWHDRGLNNEFT